MHSLTAYVECLSYIIRSEPDLVVVYFPKWIVSMPSIKDWLFLVAPFVPECGGRASLPNVVF